MSEATPRSGRNAKVVAAAVIVGLLGSGTLVWQASSAAFTATTTNAANSWDSGKVVLSDNDAGSAMFTETNLVPGNTETQCILVEFDGDVASTVKLYSNAPTGNLDQYLDFFVEKGDGATCGAFGNATTLYGDNDGALTAGNDTLDEFATAHSGWANGITSFTPSTENTVVPFRFTYTLVDNNSAQDLSATGVTFTWEARNN